MFFKDSVRGLQPGAPVEFRGIRLGTVGKCRSLFRACSRC
jgi:paraquat-inducible protein B